MTCVALTPEQLDTLRRAQLRQASTSLRAGADVLLSASERAAVGQLDDDTGASIDLVLADLDALLALYRRGN